MAIDTLLISKALALLCLATGIVVLRQGNSPFNLPKELASKLSRDKQTLALASTDYGHIVHRKPVAVFQPSCIQDIIDLIKYSYSLPTPFTIAARGGGHSVLGQSQTHDGIVVNMTHLSGFRNGSGIIVSDGKGPLGYYVDVGGEQTWFDVLQATLEHGLSPYTFTDYLYVPVGGTLSNAGISGRVFRFGPQISNVLELDIVTGEGDLVTCSPEKNSEAFYAALGGLGQFGIITRARISLGSAPTRVKWLQLLYSDFSTYSEDQEHVISSHERNDPNAADVVEGILLLDQPTLDLSNFPVNDHPRITSLVTEYGVIYAIELFKFYDNDSQANVDQQVANLIKGLRYIPTFEFEIDMPYEKYLARMPPDDVTLSPRSLFQPWLDLFVPKSRISDFNEGVIKGIIVNQNITDLGITLVYPMIRKKWDDRMSAVTPDEDIFYIVDLLHASNQSDKAEAFVAQNQQIIQFCKDHGIKAKQYLPRNLTHEEWVQQYGYKWQLIEDRKATFDPKKILSPGQRIFN